jgi:hypothetical protein
MDEQTSEITITWRTQIIEEYSVTVPIEAVAGSLEMTVDEALSADAKGELLDLIDTDWLAEWESDTSGSYISTYARWVKSVKNSQAG